MPKITITEIQAFITNSAIELYPSQHALCIPIINRIYQKMVYGLRFDDIKVCDALVIDGHHRYISSLLANKAVGRVDTHRTAATMKYDWKTVEFVGEEWDTIAKIQKLNEDDAEFNNIPIEKITEMTN